MIELNLIDGKYTVQYQDRPFVFRVLRYGEPWRDLTGDNFTLALLKHTIELEEALLELQTKMLGGNQ